MMCIMRCPGSLAGLQLSIHEHLSALLVGISSVVKRAMFHNISRLSIFLGQQRTNDVLLSHMITYLDERGRVRSLEEHILPLMIQALSDVEETVVSKVLAALTSLCELGLFQKMRTRELMSATLEFLYHLNISFASRDGTSRTEATLNPQLGPHLDAITGLAVSPNHMSFMFSSDDNKTVKVWPTARLERNLKAFPVIAHISRLQAPPAKTHLYPPPHPLYLQSLSA
ncbi:hypothetical protein FIBSPDRAFT_1043677 [Athelia psychrophila]|uniref:Phosphatase 2A Regulatory Subunit A helical domain-containing protein n=1 Tax=Athelia psychrophila TaxID=1759441 RepID=A0A166KS05_9AGAM|nr:hypothetical protein FIBSPDRAFT_1043677 [Fibularhizoctonia sp. CBS 109695]